MMADRVAWTKYAGVKLEAPRSKYGAKPLVVDGFRFDSRREAARYRELRLLEKAGQIADLELQPHYPIVVVEVWRLMRSAEWVQIPGDSVIPLIDCGRYTADFQYRDKSTGAVVIEDVKSKPTRTTAYRLRKRLVEAIYGVKITEV